MGYSNYWEVSRKKELTDEFIEDVKSVILGAQANNISICDGMGEPYEDLSDIVSKDGIWFNGDAHKEFDNGYGKDTEDHETFDLKENNFVKTNRKPYDVVVKAVLVLAYWHGIAAKIRCDGLTDSMIISVAGLLSFKKDINATYVEESFNELRR